MLLIFICTINCPIIYYYLQEFRQIFFEMASTFPLLSSWDFTVNEQACQVVLPVQLECPNQVQLGQPRPVLMLLFQLIFLLFELLHISEQQPGGRYQNLPSADAYMVIC